MRRDTKEAGSAKAGEVPRRQALLSEERYQGCRLCTESAGAGEARRMWMESVI